MKLANKTCIEFTKLLSSKSAVPGGGGTAALVGAFGTALGGMVCNLTIGKKKYARYEDELKEILSKILEIQESFLNMVDEDAENFLPLSKAYGMPSGTKKEKEEKNKVLQENLKIACETPINIMRTSFEAIKLHENLLDKASTLVVSDIGVGVQCLKSALISGHMNVVVNINMINDGQFVSETRDEINILLCEGSKIADRVYECVQAMIRQ